MQESDEWELLQSGDGAVNFTTEMLEDEDVGIWRIYDFYAEKESMIMEPFTKTASAVMWMML